jgi:hypothetical protein
MDLLSIRHAFEDKVRELGGKVLGAGVSVVAPFTADFNFKLDGKEYWVTLKQREEKNVSEKT